MMAPITKQEINELRAQGCDIMKALRILRRRHMLEEIRRLQETTIDIEEFKESVLDMIERLAKHAL